MHHPTDRITHTTAFVTPVVEHWLEREIAQWVHSMIQERSHHERTLLPRSELHLAPINVLSASLNKKHKCPSLPSGLTRVCMHYRFHLTAVISLTRRARAIRPVNTAACDPVKTHFSVVPGHKESYFNKYPTPLCAADAS